MSNHNILISFCIPTYNRSITLIQTLKSISSSAKNSLVEVVISDNCSTDDTQNVVKKNLKKYKNLRIIYKRQSRNVGLDQNILDSITFASGKYCWLLSDDDFLRSDAIEMISNILVSKKPTYLLTNYSRFNFITKSIDCLKMVGIENDLEFNKKNYKEFFYKIAPNSYFVRLSTNTITMSADIFDRLKWLKSFKAVRKYIGLNFIHIFVIAEIIRNYPKIYYQSQPVLIYTSHNARPWSNNIWKDYKQIYLKYLSKLSLSKEFLLERATEPDTWLDKKYGIIYKLPAFIYKIWQKLPIH